MIVGNLPLDSIPQLASLPVIRIAPYLAGDGHGRLSTSAALHAAAREFGFFYLDLTGFATPEETEELSRLARQFFALPGEEKEKINLGSQGNGRGMSKLRCGGCGPNLVDDVICRLSERWERRQT
jgi:isopenicillin N synthase-like dioxygenase